MAAELLLDTGGLVSILDRSQRRHAECAAVYGSWRGPVLTTEPVLTEATHLLGRVAGGQVACLELVTGGGAVVVPCSLESIRRAEALVRKYDDLPLDYADATLVVLAEDVRSASVLTLDRRAFSTVRWGRDRSFRILPG